MANRKIPEINAGSMADIAFLLLVFFLVTTTIQTDTGLSTTLPPWNPNQDTDRYPPIERRNMFDISINAADKILVRNEQKEYTQIKDMLIEFATNNGRREDYSENPLVVVVALKNDKSTSYSTYINVYNEIKAAYNVIWNAEANKLYGRPYEQLTKEERDSVFAHYPLTLSESDPEDFGAKTPE